MQEEMTRAEGEAAVGTMPRWAAPVGAAVLLALLGGAVLLTLALLGAFNGKVTDADRAGCLAALTPAVLFDPAPFGDISQADEAFLLSAAVWQALSAGEEPAGDGAGKLLVTGDAVRAAAAALFGPDCAPNCFTVMQQGVVFEYDLVEDVYRIPVTGQIGLYEPRLESLSRKKEFFTARVAYLSLDDFVEENETRPAVKTVTYTLRRQGEVYYICSLQ